MDTNNGGPFSDPNRRKTAAELAREKVLAVYSSTVKSLKKLPPEDETTPHEYTSNNNHYITPPAPGAYAEPSATSNYTQSASPSEPQSYTSSYEPQSYEQQPYSAQPSYGAASQDYTDYNSYQNSSYSQDASSAYSDFDDSYFASTNQTSTSQTFTSQTSTNQTYANQTSTNQPSAGPTYTTQAYTDPTPTNPNDYVTSSYEAPTAADPDVPTNNSANYDYSDETSALKDAPINQTAVSDEWQKYHSAWQNYYQNYYNEYYSKAAQNYLAAEKLKNERVASGTVRKKRRIKHLIPVFALLIVIFSALFLQYNRLIFAPIMAYVSPNTNSAPTSIEAVDPNVTGSVTADPRLIIPKINVDVPVSFGIDYSEAAAAMLHGVAQFKIPGASAMPGQIGNLVISGHSAGDIYSGNQYKFIFSGLERLEPGDLIYINYESVRYTYQMVGSEVVEPTNVAALVYETNKPILTLITCTPLGTSRYRLLVTAEQISPAYDGSTPSTDPIETDGDAGISMPANEPSFFENLWNGIFGN